MGLPFLLEEILYVDRSWEYINRSQTHECRNWGWGRAIHGKGIYKRNCRCSVPTNRKWGFRTPTDLESYMQEESLKGFQYLNNCEDVHCAVKLSGLHCKDTSPKIWNKYTQKWNTAASFPIPTFMFLWAIYTFPWFVCLFCFRKIDGPIVGIYKLLTEALIWKLELRPHSSFWILKTWCTLQLLTTAKKIRLMYSQKSKHFLLCDWLMIYDVQPSMDAVKMCQFTCYRRLSSLLDWPNGP